MVNVLGDVYEHCVYIIPPDQYLGIRDGVLHLTEAVKQEGIRMPIETEKRQESRSTSRPPTGTSFLNTTLSSAISWTVGFTKCLS